MTKAIGIGLGMNMASGGYALPDGTEPLVMSDFVNDVHSINGVAVDLLDIWEQHPDGGYFDPEFSIGEFGLSGSPTMKAEVAAMLGIETGLTVVLVANVGSAAAGMRCYAALTDIPDYNNELRMGFYNAAQVSVGATMNDYGGSADYGASFSLEDDHRLAGTILPDLISMSVEGSAVQTFVPQESPLTHFTLYNEGGTFIRFVGVYPPQDDADLPALSAL